jgi:hypothetical protein
MDKGIGVGFHGVCPVECRLTGTTKSASAILPIVFEPLEPNVAAVRIKALRHRMLAIGMLGTIEAPPRKQTGQGGNADAEDLPGKDVVHARLQVRDFRR